MKHLLAAKMLWDKVERSTPCPSITTRPQDNKAWLFDDTQARMWIFVNCETAQQSHFRNTKTSNQAWEALRKVHGAKHRGSINFLMKKLYNYRIKDDKSVDAVAAELKNL